RKGAAHRDDVAKQVLDRTLDFGELVRIVPKEVHVEVAVSCVPIGERADARGFGGALDQIEQVGDALARDDDVLGDFVFRQSAYGGGHLATRGPAAIALRRVLRDEDVDRAVLGARLADAERRFLACTRVAVNLDKEQRAGARVDRNAARAYGGQ